MHSPVWNAATAGVGIVGFGADTSSAGDDNYKKAFLHILVFTKKKEKKRK